MCTDAIVNPKGRKRAKESKARRKRPLRITLPENLIRAARVHAASQGEHGPGLTIERALVAYLKGKPSQLNAL